MQDFERLKGRLERVARGLPIEMLTGHLTLEDELLSDLGQILEPRFLGYYTMDGITRALREYGLFEELRSLGYAQGEVSFDLQPSHHSLRIAADGQPFAELRVRRSRGSNDPCIAEFQRRFLPELLQVDWLSITHWRSEERPHQGLLPGQTSPPSGISRKLLVLTWLMARRLNLQGIEQCPRFFHNAVIYRQKTRFIDPLFEGRFEALLQLLPRHGLYDVAWAIEEGRVIDLNTGRPIRWEPRLQLYAISGRLKRYFLQPSWRRARQQARRACRPKLLPP